MVPGGRRFDASYRRYRKLLPAVALSVFVLGFSDYGQADETTGYESYFGDEVTSATCDGICIEEWGLKRIYICQLAMNDMQCRQVPDYCEI